MQDHRNAIIGFKHELVKGPYISMTRSQGILLLEVV